MALPAVIFLLTTVVFFVDVYLLPGVPVPAVAYFVPIVIAAYFVSPKACVAATVYSVVLELLAFALTGAGPPWLPTTFAVVLVVVGYLSASLSARVHREVALSAQMERLKIKADQEAEKAQIEGERLKRSEERFRSTFEQAAVGMAHTGLDGRINRVNQRLCDILGYSAEELYELRFRDITYAEDLRLDAGQADQLVTGEINTYSIEKRYVKPDGSLVWTNLTRSLGRTPSGEPQFFITVLEDITKRKEGELSFRMLAENSPIGIYIVQQGAFRFVNAKFQEYMGYSEDELLGTDALRLVLPEDRGRVRETAVRMLRGQHSTPYEYRVVDKAGRTKWIMETVSSIQYRGKPAAVGNFLDITERRELERQLAHLATHDPLTGLPNRRLLEESMDRVVARARRNVTSALLFMDLDNFKEINDTLGHAAGDRALVEVVQVLRRQLREEDLLVRLGGDEFAILLEGTARDDIKAVAIRYCQAICDSPVVLDGHSFSLSASIGAVAIDGQQSPSVLLSHADTAMYKAKAQNGNCVVLHE